MKCQICNKDKSSEQFSFVNKNKGIKSKKCKACQKIYAAKHYEKNKKKYRERNRARKKELKAWFAELTKDHVCYFCPESEPVCIDYHHIGNDKEEIISRLLAEMRSKNRILEELRKCVPICSNCHRKLHAGIIRM